MSSELVGVWDFESSENWDEYMKEIGVNFMLRKAAGLVKPQINISNNGNQWTFKATSTLKNVEVNATEGVEFDETTPDGRECRSLIKREGDKIIHEQRDAKTKELRTVLTREIVDGKLVLTYVAGSVTCKRIYKRHE